MNHVESGGPYTLYPYTRTNPAQKTRKIPIITWNNPENDPVSELVVLLLDQVQRTASFEPFDLVLIV